MNTGMLWFDDSDRPLDKKIKRAVDYYLEKYDGNPNLCVVHPSMLPDGDVSVDAIEVRGASAVMPHHYWIGVHKAEMKASTQASRRAA